MGREGSPWEEGGGKLLRGSWVLHFHPLQSLAQYGIHTGRSCPGGLIATYKGYSAEVILCLEQAMENAASAMRSPGL